MVKFRFFSFRVWVLSCFCFSYISWGSDNFFINCGSSKNASLDNRIFEPDDSSSHFSKTPPGIIANAADSNDAHLHRSARIFTVPSSYKFLIKNHSRFWIRLHFFPFDSRDYRLSTAKFSVSAQNFTLIREYRSGSAFAVMEYSLNVTSDELVLEFTPKPGSFGFVNALEILSLPGNLIPKEAEIIGAQGERRSLQKQALQTVARVNMGNVTVNRDEDKLWRLWVADYNYLGHDNLVKFETDIEAVNFARGFAGDFAPTYVYGTGTMLNSEQDPNTVANVTWHFDVDPGFEYLVRLHFCDITNKSQQQFIFKVYIDSLYAFQVDLHKDTNSINGAPYFRDLITKASENGALNVSIGPSGIDYPNAILNGLEIMKMSNKIRSLDVLHKSSSSKMSSKLKMGLVAVLATVLLISIVSGLVIFWCGRRRSKLLHHVHSGADESSIFSWSKVGYRFPFVAIKEATNSFDESLVIGVGGFGKVYKGLLRDKTKVAVKRGAPQSQQGLAEFKTEIEMLSQFRHRHLVSLIGYCDENKEMIIVYEYMENGTLKSHLYGSEDDRPRLSWRQRLEICIGSARGLHYLHTGSTKAIIHRDVQSANILLDKNFMAKVANFGLSKTAPDVDQTQVSSAVKGSFGYLDPEYLTRQHLTKKSDVYSFGVVMFEILCGRPVIDPSLPREKVNLVELALNRQRNWKLEEIIDPFLAGQVKLEALNKYGEIAEKCLADHGVDRPTMGDVLWNLECVLQIQQKIDKSDGQAQDLTDRMEESVVSMTGSSVPSLGDISGVSMSKVFAQMVRDEMR